MVFLALSILVFMFLEPEKLGRLIEVERLGKLVEVEDVGCKSKSKNSE